MFLRLPKLPTLGAPSSSPLTACSFASAFWTAQVLVQFASEAKFKRTVFVVGKSRRRLRNRNFDNSPFYNFIYLIISNLPPHLIIM